MPNNDSDLMALEPARRIPRRWRKWFEAVVVLGGLIGGGLALGYWLGVQQEREDRIAEIGRMQAAHLQALDTLTRRTERTADAVVGAAATVSEAAAKVDSAATAATNATTAVNAAGAPAKAPARRESEGK